MGSLPFQGGIPALAHGIVTKQLRRSAAVPSGVLLGFFASLGPSLVLILI